VLGISQYGQPGLELHFVLVNRTKGPVGLLHCSTHLITSFRYTDAIEFIAQDGLGK
jgi:hypothetical protein